MYELDFESKLKLDIQVELEVQTEVIGIPLDKLSACQSTRFLCSVARAVQKSIKTWQVSKYRKAAPEKFRLNRNT